MSEQQSRKTLDKKWGFFLGISFERDAGLALGIWEAPLVLVQ